MKIIEGVKVPDWRIYKQTCSKAEQRAVTDSFIGEKRSNHFSRCVCLYMFIFVSTPIYDSTYKLYRYIQILWELLFIQLATEVKIAILLIPLSSKRQV